jgi:hypothetical protein
VSIRWDFGRHSKSDSPTKPRPLALPFREKARIHFILGDAFRKSSVLRPKRIGRGINRHYATLSLYSAFERFPNVGGILLGNRASR